MSKQTKGIILIPARLASSRLPDKPLALIGADSMIVHIARRAAAVGRAWVAAGDDSIVEAVQEAGFLALKTDPDLPSGSDRCVAALKTLLAQGEPTPDFVVNLQGDMPNISAEAIKAVQDALTQSETDCATLVHPITAEAAANPNQVKAVLALEDKKYPRCLYFSRAAVPAGVGTYWGHIGIYAWRTDSLLKFANLKPSPLEKREKLEQLRALENGMTLVAAKITTPPLSVDSPEDLEHARLVMS